MFDQLVESTSARKGARTWAYFVGSSVVWSFVLCAVAVAGIFAYDARLDADFDRFGDRLVARTPQPPPPPAPRPPGPAEDRPATALASQTEQPRAVAPPSPAPPSVGPAPVGAVDGGREGGVPGGTPGGDPSSTIPPGVPDGGTMVRPVAPPPEPPAPPAERADPPRPRQLRVSAPVLAGKATRRVEPRYPEMARLAGVSGTVVVEVVVSETGRVVSARALSGPPLLRAASEEAAGRWLFTPTLLGEVPIKVVGTITFNFRR